MAEKQAVFLKQSGERLERGPEVGEPWQPDGVRSTGEKLARTYRALNELNVTGLTVITGAGNITRGDKLREQGIAGGRADVLGRLATIQNTIVIAGELERLRVPHRIFVTPNMQVTDPAFRPEEYSPEALWCAHQDGEVALIGGGTGEDGVTTDNAVVWYAQDYRQATGEAVTVLKGTQTEGVYDGDPSKTVGARRFREIGAPQMKRDYDRFSVVDRGSLDLMQEHEISMLVYADGSHELEAVLRHDPRNGGNGSSIGTVIYPTDIAPVYYE